MEDSSLMDQLIHAVSDQKLLSAVGALSASCSIAP